MAKKRYLIFASGWMLLLAVVYTLSGSVVVPDPTSLTRVALREVGHRLLLLAGDSTSRVLPITRSQEGVYELTFDRELSIVPDSLVLITNESLIRQDLPLAYLAELKACTTDEVVYSYRMFSDTESIPCTGRVLPAGCYAITLHFPEEKSIISAGTGYAMVMGILALVPMLLLLIGGKTGRMFHRPKDTIRLGACIFYLAEHRCICNGSAITFTEKENDLLRMFCRRPNRVINREELLHEVWEKKGVIVSRSLDTYISRLRTKLGNDSGLRIDNVHGRGYRLQVS